MKRRDIVKGGLAATVLGMMPIAGVFARSSKQYIEYNRAVCSTLDGLVDYKTGKDFRQDRFVVAYFATPYNSYEGLSCETDLINIFQETNLARYYSGRKITPVMVVTPLEQGDPEPVFADKYIGKYTTDSGGGNVVFTGLTGDRDLVLETAKSYRVPFRIDRNTGEIKGHSRAAVLISPEGELIAKYLPSHLGAMKHDIIKHVKQYDADKIIPAKGCEL